MIRWCDGRIEYEADPRQAEKLIEELEMAGDGVKAVATPGVKCMQSMVDQDKPLGEDMHTYFRGIAARANYLAADRPDCQFSAKDICRWMSSPTELAMSALKRLCRYLVGRPRLVFKYNFQEFAAVECYSDTDWAGCIRTRKSTSGGVILLGSHILKTYSSTQPTVSLSSGETELYGVVKATGAALGQKSLFADLGIALKVRVWTDSSAAIGTSSRQGLGKLRHIDTHTLWVQQKVRNREIELRKAHGEANPADMLTKHLPSRDKLEQLVKLHGCSYEGGRAESAPLLRKRLRNEDVEERVAECEVDVVEESDSDGYVLVQEAVQHDIGRWPHSYPTELLDRMFPIVTAADEVEKCNEGDLGEQAALHRRWATVRSARICPG